METNQYYWNPTGGPSGTGAWEKMQGVSGAPLVSVSGGYAGPEGLSAVTPVSYDATAASGAITGTLVDVYCTTAANIQIAAAPVAVVATGYPMAAGVTYRFPITSGNKIAAIKMTGSTAGVMYIHPVA